MSAELFSRTVVLVRICAKLSSSPGEHPTLSDKLHNGSGRC